MRGIARDMVFLGLGSYFVYNAAQKDKTQHLHTSISQSESYSRFYPPELLGSIKNPNRSSMST